MYDIEDKIKSAINTGKLDKYLIYSDEFIAWLNENGYVGLIKLAKQNLQTRSYPEEILHWVEESIKYLYDDSIPKVDATKKEIPKFLLK